MSLSNVAQIFCNVVLIWIGFGTVVGFLAYLLVPVSDKGRADSNNGVASNTFSGFGTALFCGIAGSCIGPFVVTLFWQPRHFHPISPAGLVISMIPAIILLIWLRCQSRL